MIHSLLIRVLFYAASELFLILCEVRQIVPHLPWEQQAVCTAEPAEGCWGGLRQPEKLMLEHCSEAAPGSIPVCWAVLAFLLPPISEVSLSKDANCRECCKSCYSGNCVAAQRVKGVDLTLCREQTFFDSVLISQSCWAVLRCTQYIPSWNAIFFSFTPQCEPCWKNEPPLCLEVRFKYLFGCLQLLSAFKNWRLNTDTGELKSEWVTKQDQLQIRPK